MIVAGTRPRQLQKNMQYKWICDGHSCDNKHDGFRRRHRQRRIYRKVFCLHKPKKDCGRNLHFSSTVPRVLCLYFYPRTEAKCKEHGSDPVDPIQQEELIRLKKPSVSFTKPGVTYHKRLDDKYDIHCGCTCLGEKKGRKRDSFLIVFFFVSEGCALFWPPRVRTGTNQKVPLVKKKV